MIRTAYESTVLVDSSAVIALFDPADQFHDVARSFFEEDGRLQWVALNATGHETFTRTRYAHGFLAAAERYAFLRQLPVLDFLEEDESSALTILGKYSEHVISFHDALCAAVMLRRGIYKVFTFDKDFWILGFEVMPGVTG